MSNKGIPYDGFGNVLEMLRRSDAQFRDKILRNLRTRDPQLCRRLEAALGASRSAPAQAANQRDNMAEDSRTVLEKSQRAAMTRTYGH